jgi:hypothetical protein
MSLITEFFRAHGAYDAYMEKYCMEIHNNKNMNRKILCATRIKEGKNDNIHIGHLLSKQNTFWLHQHCHQHSLLSP